MGNYVSQSQLLGRRTTSHKGTELHSHISIIVTTTSYGAAWHTSGRVYITLLRVRVVMNHEHNRFCKANSIRLVVNMILMICSDQDWFTARVQAPC
jgi:hypothetical protein